MNLAKRVAKLTPSSTLAISAKATELKNEGYDVIGLGVGEPDFNTPEYIIDAAKKAMDEGHTKYTPSGGILPLKNAIIEKLKEDNNLTYEPQDIIVTPGAKYALFGLFQSILDEGDEVIVPSPYWVSYPEHVKLADGVPVIVEGLEDNDFKITKEQLENAITDKTKALIINSPSNPTGMMYSKTELLELGEVCLKHDIIIVSDEIYEALVYTDDKHVSIAEITPELKDITVVVNGVSKSHAMTGWRIGYAAGPRKIIQAMTSHGSHTTSNPTSISQYAALAAYTVPNNTLEEMKAIFSERLNRFYELISDIKGIKCVKPKGAFYLFPNVSEAVKLNGFETVDDWVKALLEEEKVALVPGTGFGAPNNVRLSYAISMDQIEEAAKRIDRFVNSNLI